MPHQTLFSRISLPSLNNYLTFSALLFVSGFYYYYRVIQSSLGGLNFDEISANMTISAHSSDLNEGTIHASAFGRMLSSILRHRLLIYILLNTSSASIALLGKTLVGTLFGRRLPTHEEQLMRKAFVRFLQIKLTFLIFISHHNIVDDILVWMPWLAIHAVCLLLLEMTISRLASTLNAASNWGMRQQLLVANVIVCVAAVPMGVFAFCMHNYVNIHYTLFLAADCILLLIQSIHVLFKLLFLPEFGNAVGVQRIGPTSSHTIDLFYDIVHDALEFANYLHMIFFSQVAVTYCCVFLAVQSKHYYTRLLAKVQKHWQHQEIVHHINRSYAKATEEDLLKNNTCTICWQIMRSARRLPCGHLFHDHCLRRWLEQDSSCAICRQQLEMQFRQHRQRGGALNRVAAATGLRTDLLQQQQVQEIEEEIDNTLRYLLQAFSPQNRFTRWWAGWLFETLADDQVAEMVNQMLDIFPQVNRQMAERLVRETGSVSLAVDALLADQQGGQARENGASPLDQAVRNPAVSGSGIQFGLENETDENSSSDESANASTTSSSRSSSVSSSSSRQSSSSASSAERHNGVANGQNSGSSSHQQVLTVGEAQPIASSYRNPWLTEQRKIAIQENKKRYLASSRADDLRQLSDL